MRSSALFVALVAAIAVAPVEATAQTTVHVDSRAVESVDGELAALRVAYAAAANAGDARRLSALYADDAIALLAEGVMLRGPAEIEKYSLAGFSAVAAGPSVTLTPKHFTAQGGMASETGTFSETPAGEHEPGATGVYVAIYTRGRDGTWRIAMEVRTRGRDQQVVRW